MKYTSDSYLKQLSNYDIKKSDDCWWLGKKAMAYSWEQPLMFQFAKNLYTQNGKILEIGFGMGIFTQEILQFPIAKYTLIEIHPELCKEAKSLLSNKQMDFNILNTSWQDAYITGEKFDSIMYDPFSEKGCRENDLFKFCTKASKELLKDNGKLGIFYAEPQIDLEIKTILLDFFYYIDIYPVKNLNINDDFKKRGLTNYMLVIVASNPKNSHKNYVQNGNMKYY